MKSVAVPETYKYIGVFLTLSCNLSCSYCINHLVGLKQGRKLLKSADWAKGFSRLQLNHDIPITLQGGEPSIHNDFYGIINSIPERFPLDLITNIQFSPDEFASKVPTSKFSRQAPYAPIRVSYHPEMMNLNNTIIKVKRMMEHGFRIGLYGVLHPSQEKEIFYAKEVCKKEGIDFRTKEFLGLHNGKIHGQFAYPDAVFAKNLKKCQCKTSELLIDPFGDIFRCHHDLYNRFNKIGNILDENFEINDIYRPCDFYGKCNPCDVKIKNNYKQEFGHTSVHIQFGNS